MKESDIIARLRRFATDPAARGLDDDAAVLGDLVLTHDAIAEGVHFFPFDPPASVGWKLVAVNLSDLAAKGATPAGALMSLTITGDGEWEQAFLSGIEAACESYGLPLLGGDTIALPDGSPRVLSMTAIGRAGTVVPDRSGARSSDVLWLVGPIGDSAAGLAQLLDDKDAVGPLVDVYRRPVPLLAAGRALAPSASAMMDVSDGLLIDALAMARASACAIAIDLDDIPLSDDFIAARGDDLDARMFAATGGDDYALLVAMPEGIDPGSLGLADGAAVARVGRLSEGPPGITLTSGGRAVPLPGRLGHEHRPHPAPPVVASRAKRP